MKIFSVPSASLHSSLEGGGDDEEEGEEEEDVFCH